MSARTLIACAVLLSCGSWPTRLLARTDKHPHSESTKEPSMSEDADPTHYKLTFRSTMDRIGNDPELFAYLNVLRIDGATGRAIMVLNRENGDLPGRPVGVFATTLKKEQILALGAAIEGVKWNETGSLKGGDITAATLSLDYSRGAHIIQRDFNAMNGQFLDAIRAVMDQITNLMTMLEDHPARAIDVAVVQGPSGFKLVVRNVGTGPVAIADPRHPNKDGATTCGWVGAARDVPPAPGSGPIPLLPVGFPALGTAPALVTIAAGKSIEVDTAAWKPSGAGKYFARGNWKDYGPVSGDPKAFLPLVPDPAVFEQDGRPYRIRGAAFSKALFFATK
jgi:hypothetical protein